MGLKDVVTVYLMEDMFVLKMEKLIQILVLQNAWVSKKKTTSKESAPNPVIVLMFTHLCALEMEKHSETDVWLNVSVQSLFRILHVDAIAIITRDLFAETIKLPI